MSMYMLTMSMSILFTKSVVHIATNQHANHHVELLMPVNVNAQLDGKKKRIVVTNLT